MVLNFRDQETRLEGSKMKPRPRLCSKTKTLKLSLETFRDEDLSLDNYIIGNLCARFSFQILCSYCSPSGHRVDLTFHDLM